MTTVTCSSVEEDLGTIPVDIGEAEQLLACLDCCIGFVDHLLQIICIIGNSIIV